MTKLEQRRLSLAAYACGQRPRGMLPRVVISLVLLLFALVGLPVLGAQLGFWVWAFSGADIFHSYPSAFTLLTYAAVANVGWSLGYPRKLVSVVLAPMLLAAFGFGAPSLFNASVQRAADAVMQGDVRAPEPLREPQVIALLAPRASDRSGKHNTEADCALICQRLLFRGHRKAVLAGVTPADGDPSKAVQLTRYWVEDRKRCPIVRIAQAGALDGEWSIWGTNLTSDQTEREIARGRCLMSAAGDIAEADTVAMESAYDRDAMRAADRVGGGVAKAGERLFQKRGDAWPLVARSYSVRYTTAARPVRIQTDGRQTWVRGVDNVRQMRNPVIQAGLRPWLGE